MPSNPVTNQTVFRTDLGLEAFWDGTRWLGTALKETPLFISSVAATTVVQVELSSPESVDKWLDSIYVSAAVVAGGTALDASNKWVLSLTKYGTGGTGTSINSSVISVDSGASDSTWRSPTTAAIGALLGTTYAGLRAVWTKTGTPGTLNGPCVVTWRPVLT